MGQCYDRSRHTIGQSNFNFEEFISKQRKSYESNDQLEAELRSQKLKQFFGLEHSFVSDQICFNIVRVKFSIIKEFLLSQLPLIGEDVLNMRIKC